MAMDEDAPISAFIDAEAGFPVIVSGAECLPTSPGTAGFLESVEDFIDLSLWRHHPDHSGHYPGKPPEPSG